MRRGSLATLPFHARKARRCCWLWWCAGGARSLSSSRPSPLLAEDGEDAHADIATGLPEPAPAAAASCSSSVSLLDDIADTLSRWREGGAVSEARALLAAGVRPSDITLAVASVQTRRAVQSVVRLSVRDEASLLECAGEAAMLHAAALRPQAALCVTNERWTRMPTLAAAAAAAAAPLLLSATIASHAAVIDEAHMVITTHVFDASAAAAILLWGTHVVRIDARGGSSMTDAPPSGM